MQKYESKATIACVNFTPHWGNKAACLEKIKTQIRQAAKQGADIIVFPELALGGYECDEEGTRLKIPCKMHQEAAEVVPGPSTQQIAGLAKEMGVYVILGLTERDQDNPAIRYNSAAVIAPEGVLGTYRKLHLAAPPRWRESTCFTAGNSIPVWNTRFGPIGVVICLDFFRFPELSRIMVLKGARLIVNPMGSPSYPGKYEFLLQQAGCRASENFVYTAVANLVGIDRATSFHGNSVIAGPGLTRFVNIYAMGGETEEVVSATVNFDVIDYWREILDWRGMRQTKLITDEFVKLANVAKE